MRKTILTKILSAVLAVIMMVGALPLTYINAFAAENDNNPEMTLPKEEVSLNASIEKEMAERPYITKDRSAIKSTSQAAVYVDGKLYQEGNFSPMWNVAMELAAFVKEGNQSNKGRYKTVEYVLNMDFCYDSSWFGEGTMTVSNRYFTIDLNGHLLWRDDHGSVISVIDQSVVTIMDSNPTKVNVGYLFEDHYWRPYGNCSIAIQGGVICGGYLRTGDGGGLYVNDESVVYLKGGTIAGNKADVGSGVYLGGASSLDMTQGNSQICYNYSAGTVSDGGAIFLRPGSSVTGGYVHHNVADDYGGGIRAKGNNISITDVVVYANEALEYGGGIYVENTLRDQTITITGCRVVGNYAPYGGGGIYLWEIKNSNLANCLVEGNTSEKNGAGICLNNVNGMNFSISGKMIIRNNYEIKSNEKIKSNLYLSGFNVITVDSLSLGSEVWIKTEIFPSKIDGTKRTLLGKSANVSQLFFFSDIDGYYVKYQDDPAKTNYGHLYFAKGTRVDDGIKPLSDFATKKLETPYTVESGEYKGSTLPMFKGYCEYNMMGMSDFDAASPFYYTDGYFLEDPTVYNTHLASMSINLAVSAFGRYTDFIEDNAYAIHFANVKQLLSDIGCADSNFYANEDYMMKPAYYGDEGRLSTIAVAISQKKIEVSGETYTLVPVAIRGAGYESEWASNVSIGLNGEAQGFSDAATQVYGHIQNYIENYGLANQVANGKVKFWVVGYSRAGATANLTSKRLIDNYAELGNQVYGYTFEAPMGGVEGAVEKKDYTGNGTYPTIHNTVNELDFVTYVAPEKMGFMRYGVDHLIGTSTENENGISYKTDSKYYQQRQQMIAQLNAINPYYKFNDEWEVADINIILSRIPLIGTNLIDKGEQWYDNPNPEARTMYTFLDWFFEGVVKDGLHLPEKDGKPDFSLSRDYYCNTSPFANLTPKSEEHTYSDMTIQQAVASLMYLVMEGLTEAEMNALQETVMYNASVIFDSGIFSLLERYWELIKSWDSTKAEDKPYYLYNLINQVLIPKEGKSIYSVLPKDKADTIYEALPVLAWFLLNYASHDYQKTSILNDDGMWAIGTFINNMETIVSYHYQEISVAWVRSYDSYYANDLQAYTINKAAVKPNAPKGSYANATKTLSISADAGSSVFYSVDGGENWILYTQPVQIENASKNFMCFSISRGVKSEVSEITTNPYSGTLLGDGKVWFMIIGSALIVGAIIFGFETKRKK